MRGFSVQLLGDGPAMDAVRRHLDAAEIACVDRGADIVVAIDADGPSDTATFPITSVPDGLLVGPLAVPGATACRTCRDAQLGTRRGPSGPLEPALYEALARHLVAGLAALGDGELTTRAVHLTGRQASLLRVLPRPDCPDCSGDRPPSGLHARAIAELAADLEREASDGELRYSLGHQEHPDEYRSVCILGGGTAGYLTAMAFRQRRPHMKVTLIESKKIPIISVGEATTVDMVKFLHAPHLLGLDIVDFHARVRPTFKLGIQFLWGAPETGRFHYPFQYSPLLEPQLYDGDLDTQSVAAQLMAQNKAPLYAGDDGELFSLLDVVRFGYHLDNERFVHFLAEESVRRGVEHVDAVITRAVTAPDGETIDRLITDDGRELRFDLYVDASGFRSMLLEGALGSPFTSYDSSLFNDRAWAVSAPTDGTVRPFTQARTMDAGWCWTIPFEDSDHLGYVFSSRFVSEDAALAEMRRVHPRFIGEPRLVKFRSGRHQHFFKGNVVAVGNAFGFVEPLESTALHMLVYEIEHLLNHFPLKSDRATKHALDTKIGGLWDQLRWFLAVHYRFNRRASTPYWSAAADCDVSGVADRIAAFREKAPLSDRPSLYYSVFAPDFFSGDHAFDTLLLGQKIDARLGPPRVSGEHHRQRAVLRRKAAQNAIGQARGLPMLRERPDLLRRFVESPASWVHNWVQR